MANELRVQIASIIFNESIPAALPTTLYLLNETAGLLSNVPLGESRTPKQGDHGIITGLSFYRERVLRFRGELHALDGEQSTRKTAQLALEQALALPAQQSYSGADGFVLVRFTDEDSTLKQCYAKLSEKSIEWDIPDNTDPARRGFEFEMIAADPFLYAQELEEAEGEESIVGTNVALIGNTLPILPTPMYLLATISCIANNAGIVEAAPVVTVTGPTESPKVVNQTTGIFMHLDGLTLGVGETATFDILAKTILKNDGTDLSGFFTPESNWMFLAVGDNEISALDDTPGSLDLGLLVQWRPRWI